MLARARFLALAAAGAAGAPRALAAQPALGTLRVGGSPNDDLTPVVYAQRTGLFAKYGLAVEIQKTSSGSAAAAAVAGGAFDVAKSSITSIFDAYEHSIHFSVLAPAAMYDGRHPAGGFLLAKDSPVKTGKDCEGRTFSLAALGSIGRPALLKWVDLNGGNPAAVRFVELPFGQVAAAIEQGRIAGGETAPPAQSEAIESGKFVLLPAYSAIAPRYAVAVYYTLLETSRKRPEAIRAFVRAFYEAAAFTNTHHDVTAKLMADFTGIPLARYQTLERIDAGTDLRLADLQPSIDAAAKYGSLAHAFPAREIVDPNATAE